MTVGEVVELLLGGQGAPRGGVTVLGGEPFLHGRVAHALTGRGRCRLRAGGLLAASLRVTEQTANVLRLRTPGFASPILSDCRTFNRGRYLRRWARRLRDFEFSPEDAIVLAYGSFGISADGAQTGADAVVTAGRYSAAINAPDDCLTLRLWCESYYNSVRDAGSLPAARAGEFRPERRQPHGL